jgi:hypothetical protein
MLCVSFVRIMIFFPLFAVALWLRLGPWAFFISVFLLGFTAGCVKKLYSIVVVIDVAWGVNVQGQ